MTDAPTDDDWNIVKAALADEGDIRARLLWNALEKPMGEDGFRLILEATRTMSQADFWAALRQIQD